MEGILILMTALVWFGTTLLIQIKFLELEWEDNHRKTKSGDLSWLFEKGSVNWGKIIIHVLNTLLWWGPLIFMLLSE